jgi:hypothetical protein
MPRRKNNHHYSNSLHSADERTPIGEALLQHGEKIKPSMRHFGYAFSVPIASWSNGCLPVIIMNFMLTRRLTGEIEESFCPTFGMVGEGGEGKGQRAAGGGSEVN